MDFNFQLFKTKIEDVINSSIKSFEEISGGDTTLNYKFTTENNISFFAKISDHKNAEEMLQKEAASLLYLKEHTIFKTPKVYHQLSSGNTYCLIMEWIDRKIADLSDMETFGIQLADMHQMSSDKFGWHEDNFISILPQSNTQSKSWSEFYLNNRIIPLLEKGIRKGIFEIDIKNHIPHLRNKIESEIPEEPPALIHGDLWGGNYIISRDSTPVIIDPAIYFGHREMDLAMSLLFGSFGRVFYEAYQTVYPLEKGFESRLPLLQLYPLLVHAILFKGSYISRVENIISK